MFFKENPLARFELVSLSPPSVHEAEGVEGVGKSHTSGPPKTVPWDHGHLRDHFILGLLWMFLIYVECGLRLKYNIFKSLES